MMHLGVMTWVDVGPHRFEELVKMDPVAWAAEAGSDGAFLDTSAGRLQDALGRERRTLVDRVRTAVS